MTDRPSNLRELFQSELPRLYAFAYYMCCDRVEAKNQLRGLVKQAQLKGERAVLGSAKPEDELLAMLARTMEDTLGRKAEYTFEGLDQTLRSDITRPIDLHGNGLSSDPKKLHLLLWQLKRTCLTATLGCLPPGVRISFVLTDLLGYGPAEASHLLGIKESAYRVRLTRARKRIEDYLAPRCYHVDRQNPCTCSGRLGIAMDAGFVREPPHELDIPHEPHDSEGPRRDVGSLYRGLPVVKLTDAELRELAAAAG